MHTIICVNWGLPNKTFQNSINLSIAYAEVSPHAELASECWHLLGNQYSLTLLVYCKEQINICEHGRMRADLFWQCGFGFENPCVFYGSFPFDEWTPYASPGHLSTHLKISEDYGKCLVMFEQCRAYSRDLSIQWEQV